MSLRGYEYAVELNMADEATEPDSLLRGAPQPLQRQVGNTIEPLGPLQVHSFIGRSYSTLARQEEVQASLRSTLHPALNEIVLAASDDGYQCQLPGYGWGQLTPRSAVRALVPPGHKTGTLSAFSVELIHPDELPKNTLNRLQKDSRAGTILESTFLTFTLRAKQQYYGEVACALSLFAYYNTTQPSDTSTAYISINTERLSWNEKLRTKTTS